MICNGRTGRYSEAREETLSAVAQSKLLQITIQELENKLLEVSELVGKA